MPRMFPSSVCEMPDMCPVCSHPVCVRCQICAPYVPIQCVCVMPDVPRMFPSSVCVCVMPDMCPVCSHPVCVRCQRFRKSWPPTLNCYASCCVCQSPLLLRSSVPSWWPASSCAAPTAPPCTPTCAGLRSLRDS